MGQKDGGHTVDNTFSLAPQPIRSFFLCYFKSQVGQCITQTLCFSVPMC